MAPTVGASVVAGSAMERGDSVDPLVAEIWYEYVVLGDNPESKNGEAVSVEMNTPSRYTLYPVAFVTAVHDVVVVVVDDPLATTLVGAARERDSVVADTMGV